MQFKVKGLAEKSVQMDKDILRKTNIAVNNFELMLLEYRDTQVDGLASLFQLLMSRNFRSIVLCTKDPSPQAFLTESNEARVMPEQVL